MSATRILLGAFAALIVLALGFNQWRLNRVMAQLHAAAGQGATENAGAGDEMATRLRQAEASFQSARTQLEVAEQRLAAANNRLAQLDQRVQQLESGRSLRLGPRSGLVSGDVTFVQPETRNPNVKRGWGPEQVIGEPDTMQAGDISTAWAPREQDAGEEWLKLDYEKAVDITEVRVRETYNPGAISKVTAFLANGSEVTLWEGVEPRSVAPVEMSFTIPNSVNAKSVKVYLDTARVPGWNEIDAVQIIGRDGSQQWAKQATASSTYAEPRLVDRTRRLTEFE